MTTARTRHERHGWWALPTCLQSPHMISAVPLSTTQLRRLRTALLAWYDLHRRDLPWRADADPYRVWVSEIMLQQTRVAAVLDHYARWMQKFPSVEKLAAAREQSVLAAWSGLGYYHRARRMHQAAKFIVREHQGQFPQSAEELKKLPGIGRYTAAAIASIAFGESVAVVDGNVERVLARLFGRNVDREDAWQQAQDLLSRDRPGDFNQAMMELGATICTPRAPQCLVCPLITWCATRGAGETQPQSPRKREQLCYALVPQKDAVLLVQRPADSSLMAGMWELPAIPQTQRNGNLPLARLRHSITDTDYDVSVIFVCDNQRPKIDGKSRYFTRRQWEKLALTGLARKILGKLAAESPKPTIESN